MFQDINNNFRICIKCNALLINEEFESHSCFKIKNIFIDKNRIWVNDGEGNEWYRWYGFSPDFQHPFKTPKKPTKPFFLIVVDKNLYKLVLVNLINTYTYKCSPFCKSNTIAKITTLVC